jgi:glutamyl-tRNA reductase
VKLVLVGISHQRAPVEVRERVALDRQGSARLAAELADEGMEAVCLSTCNRTELYLAHADTGLAERRAAAVFERAGVGDALYRLFDEAAALHLFRVAAGLDSLVPGEGEILGQVRDAYESGRPAALLDRLFRQALHAGKKVRAQTRIAESPASVSGAAAALAQQVFGDLGGSSVLLVGAGKVSELTARNLLSRGGRVAFVANRSPDRAAELARRLGARPLGLDRIAGELAVADVVISSTSAPGLVVGRADVERALRARRGRPLFLIDLAVPRDIDPAIHELDGCFLYDIDDLEAVVADSLAARRGEAERAEAIVAEHGREFRRWQASLEVVPAIASLRARAEEIRAAELARLDSRLRGLPEGERRAVEALTAQIVNKLLHLPTVRMKEAAVTTEGVVYADAVRHLFGLVEEDN